MNGRFQKAELGGQRFGLWLVEGYAGSDGRNATWDCVCDCGTRRVMRAAHLTCGVSESCGCLARLKARELSTRHGEIIGGVRSAEYIAWSSMRQRCFYKPNKKYALYGGRGITVCERWNIFENFFEDMGRKPSPRHTLDRYPNNDGNYEPGNCRWATYTEQNRNRRNSRMVEIGYERIPLAEACRRLGVNYFTVHGRMRKGESFAQATSHARVNRA